MQVLVRRCRLQPLRAARVPVLIYVGQLLRALSEHSSMIQHDAVSPGKILLHAVGSELYVCCNDHQQSPKMWDNQWACGRPV